MGPKSLIDTTFAPDLPAPAWFIDLFKMLGFTLHAVPMNLWYAGIMVAMLLYLTGSRQGTRFSARLMGQMPVIVALGINFGIVPLLFLQVGYARAFYPATILMAWFWLAIIVLLIGAYVGVYVYAFGLRSDGSMPAWRRASGWLAAGLFVAIGFLFANGLSLVENVTSWPDLWQKQNFHGAVLGTALNVGDARFWPRWLLMFGLALGTTAVWLVFDAAWFAGRESAEYRAWAGGFGLRLYTLGAAWFATAGSWYVFLAWPAGVRQAMFAWPWVILTVATAIAPGLPWLLLWRSARHEGRPARARASLVALAQLGVLGMNAVSRTLVQKLELRPYLDLSRQPVATQWSPMIVFLTSFVLGLAIVAWIIAQVARLPTEAEKA